MHKLSSNKKLSSKFLCEEDNLFLSILREKLSNKKASAEFSWPYKFTILWRHILHWHDIRARILYLLIVWFRRMIDSTRRLAKPWVKSLDWAPFITSPAGQKLCSYSIIVKLQTSHIHTYLAFTKVSYVFYNHAPFSSLANFVKSMPEYMNNPG